MKRILVLIIILLEICGCSTKSISNQAIDSNVVTAKQVVKACEPYMNQIVGNSNYLVGQIIMKVDDNHRGEVTITFLENASRGEPMIYQAKVNTLNSEIVKIEMLGRDSKINPGVIHFDDWTVDSTDAVNIALKQLSNFPNFNYNWISIDSNNDYIYADEIWDVDFVNSHGIYYVYIDPTNGNIIGSGEASEGPGW